MAITFKQQGKVVPMSEALAVLNKFKKDMGDNVAHLGNEIAEVERIPTGILPLDLAIGGGFPRNRICIVYGAESSGKTALSYLAMAEVQRQGQIAVFVDLERTYDPAWASKFGLDLSKLIVLDPNYAEQAVDMVEAMLYANDVGIVVLDSVAAMTTDNEISSSAEKMNVGGNSYIVGKMVRKATRALGRENAPCLMLLNQIRHKIGVMFGDPETFPGGNSLRFASAMTIRLYGKDEIVKEVNPQIPTFKHITGSIKKAKVPVTSKAFEYDLTLIPHDNMTVGKCPSWNYVATYCKNAGWLTQAGQGKPWVLFGKEGKTQKDIRQLYEVDMVFQQQIHKEIFSREMNGHIIAEVVDEETIDLETGEILNAQP